MSIMKDWNTITQITAFPCAEPSPIIWAQTLLPAVAPSLLSFISYSCRDIIKFKAGIGQPCGKIFKAAAAKTFGPHFTDPVTHLLKFIAPIERANFWFFVADLTADAVARWTSMAYKMNGCAPLNQGASWDFTFLASELTPANTPVPIQGVVNNYQGDPGYANTTGCLVPAGWHAQLSFQASAHATNSTRAIGLETWVRIGGSHPFDLPANVKPPGYPGQSAGGHYVFKGVAPDRGGPTQYSMFIMTDENGLTDSLTGNCSVTPTDPLTVDLDILSCLKDLGAATHENPAGINRASKPRGILDPFIPPELRPVRRGPPGGLPRAKPLNKG